jgi:hypothetical protein
VVNENKKLKKFWEPGSPEKRWGKCFSDAMFRTTGDKRFSLSLSILSFLPPKS